MKHVLGDGHDYYQVRCNEVVGGKVVWFDPPHPATSFRSYPTLVDGAREYLMILRGHFGLAWPAVEAGDVAQFAHLLKQARYYTDDEGHYTNSLVQCYHMLDLAILPEPAFVPLKPSAGVLHDDELLAETKLDPPDFDP